MPAKKSGDSSKKGAKGGGKADGPADKPKVITSSARSAVKVVSYS